MEFASQGSENQGGQESQPPGSIGCEPLDDTSFSDFSEAFRRNSDLPAAYHVGRNDRDFHPG